MALGLLSSRSGRRRRVLNDDMSNGADSASEQAMAQEEAPMDGPRYTESASVENHAQVTDFIPRMYRTIFGGLFAGVALSAGLILLGANAAQLATAASAQSIDALTLSASGSLSAWFASSVLLVAAVYSLLIYSLRRHKIDDYRGRYRLWLWVAGSCTLLSLNTVAPLHSTVASLMSNVTGWEGPANGAVWWMGPCALLAAWVGLRALIDVSECRLALAALVLSTMSGAIALTTALGGLSIADTAESLLFAGTTLGCYVLLLTGLLLYARFVVLDAQGLIEHKPRVRKSEKPAKKQSKKSKSSESQENEDDSNSERSGRRHSTNTRIDPAHSEPNTRKSKSKRRSRVAESSETTWVDGSQPEEDWYDDEDDYAKPKLSKADRKRLRKQKARERE